MIPTTLDELLRQPCRPALTFSETAVMDPPMIASQDPTVGPLDMARASGEAVFQVFSGVLRAFEEGGRKRIQGVASSTAVDLHGDTMELSALEDMQRDAVGMTMFMNHRYDVPEDVFGTVKSATLKQNGVDAKGDVMWHLGIDIEVEDENPRALKSWNMINRGTKLGFSIGALIPHDGGATRDKKSGALTIHHVKLLEISCVGIPANQESWATGTKSWAGEARKSVDRQQQRLVEMGATVTDHQLGAPVVSIKDGEHHIRGALNGLQLDGDDAVDVTAAADEPVADGAPDPDVEASRVRIIEIDTGDGEGSPSASSDGDGSSEGAGSGEPSEDFAAPDPEVTTSVDDAAAAPAPADGPSFEQAALLALGGSYPNLVAGIAAQGQTILDLQAQLQSERTLRLEAEATVRRLASETQQVLARTQEILTALGNLPMGRTADPRVLAQANRDLGHLEGIYSREFLDLLGKPATNPAVTTPR